MSAAAAIAVVCVMVVAGGVVILYPSLAGGTKATTGGGSTRSYSLNFTSATEFSPPPAASTSTSATARWDPFEVANVTLNDPRDYGWIRSAWNYTYSITQTGSSPVLVSNYIQTLGPLVVEGNWTTGYTLNYTKVTDFNVTVQFTPPNRYQVIRFWTSNHTVPFEQVMFNATQQKAISIAMTNSSVRSDAVGSTTPYFVDAAFPFPSGNKTFGGDYLVLLYQFFTGSKVVGVFVSLGQGAVVSTYQSSRAAKTCYPNGFCFNSPWWG